MMYPEYVWTTDVEKTVANMKQYDLEKETFQKKCEEIEPNYWNLPLRRRMLVRDEAEKALGYRR